MARYILLNTATIAATDAGVIYPIWKAFSDTSHAWGLITSTANDNELLRTVLEKLGCVRDTDVTSTSLAGYLWPFLDPFDGSEILSQLPDFQTPPDLSLDAWKLPAGTVVNT